MGRRAACLVVVALLGLAALGGSVRASFPGPRGYVAFLKWGAGNEGNIWVANRNGANPRRVTGGATTTRRVEEWSPSFFPDGQRFAYVSMDSRRFNIYVKAVTDTDPSDPGDPVFPARQGTWINSLAVDKTGNRIVYVADLGDEELFSIGVDGTDQRRLTNNGARDLQPDVSPRNGTIAFVRRLGRRNQEIFTMHADGSGLKRLTHSREVEVAPSFSPSGRKIVYSQRVGRALRGGAQGAAADWTIFVMNADGSQKRRLTPRSVSGENPVFSPDGRSILFQRWDGSHSELAVMRVDGTHIQRFLRGSPGHFDEASPDWGRG